MRDIDAFLDARRVDTTTLADEPLVSLAHVEEELHSLEARLADVERAQRLGAEVPRSLLLSGPAGGGKTHTARALARRLGLPVYELAVDDLSASTVKAVFARLKVRHERSILAIDEIDLVGTARGRETDAGAKRTLAALLTELDGLRPASGVLLVAATSQPVWQLDDALTRAGRLGFTIFIRLPDADARRALLAFFLRDRPLADDVDLEPLVAMTNGATPADLRAGCVDAAGIALAAGRDAITQADFVAAFERAGRVMPIPAERDPIDPADFRRVVVHEAAHAVVGAALHGVAWVRGAVIGEHSGSVDFSRHPDGDIVVDEGAARDSIAIYLAGYLGERAVLGSAALGHENDVEAATAAARDLVVGGLEPSVPPIDIDESLVRRGVVADRAAEAVAGLLSAGRERATTLIATHRATISAVADFLAAQVLPKLSADPHRRSVDIDGAALRAELERLLGDAATDTADGAA